MLVRTALGALASAGLVFGSTTVAAAPVGDVRAASPIAEAEDLRGSFHIMLLLIVIAAVLGVAFAGDEDLPQSP